MRSLWTARYRVVEAVLVLVGLGWLVVPAPVVDVVLLLVWDALAFAYCLTRWLRIRRHRVEADEPGDGPPAWLHSLLGRRAGFAATVVVSLIGMSAGVLILIARGFVGSTDPGAATTGVILQVCAAPAVVMAWLLLHFGYSDRYAHLYYQAGPEPVLGFPGTDRPNLLDFAYFSFTVGSSFAASDVEIRARSLRYTVLVHSVVSFFYNTAILGIAIGVLTGI